MNNFQFDKVVIVDEISIKFQKYQQTSADFISASCYIFVLLPTTHFCALLILMYCFSIKLFAAMLFSLLCVSRYPSHSQQVHIFAFNVSRGVSEQWYILKSSCIVNNQLNMLFFKSIVPRRLATHGFFSRFAIEKEKCNPFFVARQDKDEHK